MRVEKPDLSKPWHIRVDRKSPLGNPFIMYCEEQRHDVCNKYHFWFYNQIEILKEPPFILELERIQKIYRKHGVLVLYCWCAPKRCHAETIRDWLNDNEYLEL